MMALESIEVSLHKVHKVVEDQIIEGGWDVLVQVWTSDESTPPEGDGGENLVNDEFDTLAEAMGAALAGMVRASFEGGD